MTKIDYKAFEEAAEKVRTGTDEYSCNALSYDLYNPNRLFWEKTYGDTTRWLSIEEFGDPDSTEGRDLRVQLLLEMAIALKVYYD